MMKMSMTWSKIVAVKMDRDIFRIHLGGLIDRLDI
jgi:hypothetical protein